MPAFRRLFTGVAVLTLAAAPRMARGQDTTTAGFDKAPPQLPKQPARYGRPSGSTSTPPAWIR